VLALSQAAAASQKTYADPLCRRDARSCRLSAGDESCGLSATCSAGPRFTRCIHHGALLIARSTRRRCQTSGNASRGSAAIASRKNAALVAGDQTRCAEVLRRRGHDFSAKVKRNQPDHRQEHNSFHGHTALVGIGRSAGVEPLQRTARSDVLGPSELPVSTLEDQGRALWGDTKGER